MFHILTPVYFTQEAESGRLKYSHI